MRISTKGRYSLEALLYMALLPEGQSASTKTIADSNNISDGYLEQLFIPLRKAGIVQGVRGPSGGYLLGRPTTEISVGNVLRSVEGSLEVVDCVDSKVCPYQDQCISRHTWAELYAEVSGCIDSISLKDLVEAYSALDKVEYTI